MLRNRTYAKRSFSYAKRIIFNFRDCLCYELLESHLETSDSKSRGNKYGDQTTIKRQFAIGYQQG